MNCQLIRALRISCLPIFSIGRVVYFTDEKFGKVRFRGRDFKNEYERKDKIYCLQRQIDGEWYEHVPPDIIRQCMSFPLPFVTGCHYWVGKQSKKCLIQDQTGRTIAELDDLGRLSIAPQSYVTMIPDSSFDEYDEESDDEADLLDFERGKQTVLEYTEQGLTKLSFPRFTSQEGVPLTFELIQNENGTFDAIYMGNRNLKLVSKKPKGLFLGSIDNALLLFDEKRGEFKVIVPLRPLNSKDIPDLTFSKQIGPRSGGDEDEETTLTYFIYDIKDGELKTSSTAAKLFLSYIYFSQGMCQKSIEIRKQIEHSDSFDQKAEYVLKECFFKAKKQSPNAIALSLHFYLAVSRRGVTIDPRFFDPTKAIRDYYNRLSLIDEALLLTEEQEKSLEAPYGEEDVFFTLNGKAIPEGLNKPVLPSSRKEHFETRKYGPLSITPPQATGNRIREWNKGVPTFESLLPPGLNLDDSKKSDNKNLQDFVLKKIPLSELEERLSWVDSFPLPTLFDSGQKGNSGYFRTLYDHFKYPNSREEYWDGQGFDGVNLFPLPSEKQNRDRELWSNRLFAMKEVALRKKDKYACTLLDYLHFVLQNPKNGPYAPMSTSLTGEKCKKWIKELELHFNNYCGRREREKRSEETSSNPVGGKPPILINPTKRLLRELPDRLDLAVDEEPLKLSLNILGLNIEGPPSERELENEGPTPDTSFLRPPRTFPESQALYKEAIIAEFKRVTKEYNAGFRQNAQKPSSASSVNWGITSEMVKRKEAEVLKLANKESSDPKIALREDLMKAANITSELTMDKLIILFRKKRRSLFLRANPYLSQEEISTLYSLIGEYLLLSILERKLDHIFQYKPDEYPEFLIFEYKTGKNIRSKQGGVLKELLAKTDEGKYPNLIEQLMMGQGKSTVIAVILLLIAAVPGKRLSLFVTIAAQYESVVEDLKNSQRIIYDQEVVPIDLKSKERTLPHLNWMLKELKEAMIQGKVVIMKDEMIRGLYLQWTACLKKNNKEEASVLKQILSMFRKNTDVSVDEVHAVLKESRAVNRPEGDKKHLSWEYIDLFVEIFKPLLTPELEILVGLRKNRQALLSPEDYKSKVHPKLAEAIMKYKSLGIPPEHCDAFKDYVRDEISYKAYCAGIGGRKEEGVDRAHVAFIEFLVNLHESDDPDAKRVANLIAYARHFLIDVLPITLGRSGGRHYGRAGKGDPKVIPFHLGEPGTTEMAHPPEIIACGLQMASHDDFGIDSDQIKRLAKKFKESAEYFMLRDKIPFEQTVEAKEFFAITGVHLDAVDDPKKLEKIRKNLQSNPENRLLIEARSAAGYVVYRPEHITSTAQSFPNQFSTFRGFSGTPWNSAGYAPRLKTKFDIGTEGRILDVFLNKKKFKAHTITSENCYEILKSILSPKVHGLLDGGGVLKKYSTLAVARDILRYLKDINSEMKSVLFFYRAPGRVTADTLALLKQGAKEPILIKGTRLEEIQGAGIGIGQYFTFYDERHGIGTNLPLDPKATFYMTIGEKMCLWIFLQILMRPRDYFQDQKVEFLIPEHIRSLIVKEGEKITAHALLRFLITNEAIFKAKAHYRSYRHMIDNLFEEEACKLLYSSSDIEEDAKIVKKLKYFLIKEESDSPFKQFGSIYSPVPTLEALTTYLQSQLRRFEKAINSIGPNLAIQIHELLACAEKKGSLPSEVKEEDGDFTKQIKTLLTHAKENECLPSEVKGAVSNKGQNGAMGTGRIGMEQNIEVEQTVEVEVEVEVERELEIELREERESYLDFTQYTPRKESLLTNRKMELIATTTPLSKLNHDWLRIRLLSSFFREFEYKENYGKIFGEMLIYATENFMHSYEKLVSAFDKGQRPPHQIVIIEHEGVLSYLLISEKEAASFKKWLRELYKKDEGSDAKIWMVHPDGRPMVMPRIYQDVRGRDGVEQALIAINAFDGNIAFLDSKQDSTRKWLKRSTEIKLRFLKLKVEKDPKQRAIFDKSPLFNSSTKRGAAVTFFRSHARHQVQEFLNRDQSKIDLSTLDPLMARYLDNKRVAQLRPTMKALFLNLTPDQIPYISPDCVPYIPQRYLQYLTTKEQIQVVSRENFRCLVPRQMALISGEQVGWIRPSQKERIQNVSPDLLLYFNERCVEFFTPHQRSFIPDERPSVQNLNVEQPNPAGSALDERPSVHQVKYLTVDQITILAKRAPWLMKYLTKSQIEQINDAETIACLPDSSIDSLSAKQVHFLARDRLHLLTKPEQIRALSFWRWSQLTPRQLKKAHPLQAIITVTIRVARVILPLIAALSLLVATIHLSLYGFRQPGYFVPLSKYFWAILSVFKQ